MVDVANGADVEMGLLAFEFATGGFDGERGATAGEDGGGGGDERGRKEEERWGGVSLEGIGCCG